VATKNDWTELRDSMMGLDVRLSAIEGPDDWTLPADLSGDAAHAYLERVYERLQHAKEVVQKAADSPIDKVKEAGAYVAKLAGGIAEQAAKVAAEAADDMTEGFKSIAGYFEESAKTVATLTGGTVALLLLAFYFLFNKGR